MTEPTTDNQPNIPVATTIPPSIPTPSEVRTAPKTYDNTIYKAGYWYGGKHIQLFLNHNVGDYGTFSILILNSSIRVPNSNKLLPIIFNFVNSEENVAFARAVMSKLTPAEIALLGYEQIRKE